MTSLYIHIPFCEKKCFYCSFVVAIGQEHRTDAYLDALQIEAKRWQGTEIQSLYIGGGTPTFLQTSQLQRLFHIIRSNFRFDPSAIEMTIEANPEGIDPEKSKMLLDLGVNRISLGVQTFQDHHLKFLGRCHDSQTALRTFAVLRQAGFKNMNVDLMYGFPQQTFSDIERDLQVLQELNPEHVSLYTLTVEENSRFYIQKLILPNNQKLAEQYEFVTSRLEKIGYAQYEVSNFSKPNHQSQHNINYWRSGNYIGLGVGAHSHKDGQRSWNVRRVNDYIVYLNDDKDVIDDKETLTGSQRFSEALVFGLRMNQGIDVEQLQKRFGCTLSEHQQGKIKEFVGHGFMVRENGHLQVSAQGRLVLDELSSYLI